MRDKCYLCGDVLEKTSNTNVCASCFMSGAVKTKIDENNNLCMTVDDGDTDDDFVETICDYIRGLDINLIDEIFNFISETRNASFKPNIVYVCHFGSQHEGGATKKIFDSELSAVKYVESQIEKANKDYEEFNSTPNKFGIKSNFQMWEKVEAEHHLHMWHDCTDVWVISAVEVLK